MVVTAKVYTGIIACISNIRSIGSRNITYTWSPDYISCRAAAGDGHGAAGIDGSTVRHATVVDYHIAAGVDGSTVRRAAAGDVHIAAGIDGSAVRHAVIHNIHRTGYNFVIHRLCRRKQLVTAAKVYTGIIACISNIRAISSRNITHTWSPDYISCCAAAGDRHAAAGVDGSTVRHATDGDEHGAAGVDGSTVRRTTIAVNAHVAAGINGSTVRHATDGDDHGTAGVDGSTVGYAAVVDENGVTV